MSRKPGETGETRRTFLKLTGAVAASAALAPPVTAAAGWQVVDSGVGTTLYDAAATAEGPYAVGSGGLVLARRADRWRPVLETGPTTESNPLRGCDVTDDGRNLWFCGGSGVVGQYDVVEEQLTDYSAPMGKTSTWLNVAVQGSASEETVYLVNGSGEFLAGTKTSAGGMDWGEVVKPGGGSSAPGIDFWDTDSGYVVDTNSKVYRTEDGGRTWTTVGINGGSVALNDVAVRNEGDLDVAAGSGTIYRLNDGDGKGWKRKNVGEQTVLAVYRTGAEGGLGCGTGGYVYDRKKNKWERRETPTSNTLRGVATSDAPGYPQAAVGDSGTVVERGDYTATPSDLLTVTSADGSEVSYRVEVEGVVESADLADGEDSVSGSTVEGTVGGGDTSDSYRFSGPIVDFVVTSGDATALTIGVNEESQTVGQLSGAPWTEADSPTGNALNGAAIGADGPYAVSGGGEVLARGDDGWTVVTTFPGGGTTYALTCADAAADGGAVWFAGASGALGRYDTASGTVSDYSAPKEKTSTWETVSVAGAAGSETVYLANGSGEVLQGTNAGGTVTWGDVAKPGGGSSIKGATVTDPSTAYFVDTNAKVYETTDGGSTYSTIGIDGGSVGLYGVGAGASDDLSVAGGDGSVFRYNGAVWTKLTVGTSGFGSLVRDGSNGLVCGGSGSIYRRAWDGWTAEETPAAVTLNDVAIGGEFGDVAVGASGTIFERRL